MTKDKDLYYLNICEAVSKNSSCTNRQVGAIVVLHDTIVSIGYNGTPRGILNCDQGGCPKSKTCSKEEGKPLCCHAEENAIIHGSATCSMKGATLYSTLQPCHLCAKMIIQAGIKIVIFKNEHHNTDGLKLLTQAGVAWGKYSE